MLARLKPAVAGAALLAGSMVMTDPADAAVHTVTVATDGGAGSLRAAIDDANANPGADTIVLGSGVTYDLTICADDDTNAGGDLDVLDGPLVIQGNGSTIRQTCAGRRVLDHETSESLQIEDATITGGTEDDSGGGIAARGPVTLVRSTVTGNTAASDGGGIDASDPLTLVSSTVSGNTAGGDGGGITAYGLVTLTDSTVSGNTATGEGGGIWAYDGLVGTGSTVSGNSALRGDGGGIFAYDDVELTNSTVTGNTSTGAGGGIFSYDYDMDLRYVTISGNTGTPSANVEMDGGSFITWGSVIANPIGGTNCGDQSTSSGGYNYSDDLTCDLDDVTDAEGAADPQLGSLAANGGPTRTLLPAQASPLVDAIPLADGGCSGVDQRAVVRPQLGGCDIGAVEVEAVVTTTSTTTTSTTAPSTSTTSTTVPPGPATPIPAQPTFTG